MSARVAVVGAGLSGLATARALLDHGCMVEVFERAGAVGAGATFAPVGLVDAGWTPRWQVPGTPDDAGAHGWFGRWLHGEDDASWLREGGTPSRAQRRWLERRRQVARRRPWLERWTPLAALARHSAEIEQRWSDAALRPCPDDAAPGALVLLHDDRERVRTERRLEAWGDLAPQAVWHDPAQLAAFEPQVREGAAPHALLQLRAARSVNLRRRAQWLRDEALERGATLWLNRHVSGVTARSGAAGVEVRHHALPDGGPARSDAYEAVVLCAGTGTAALLAPHRVPCPLAGVERHSMTWSLRHVDGVGLLGPRAALLDTRSDTWITRLDQRVRVGGPVRFGGDAARFGADVAATLEDALARWFPGATSGEPLRWKASSALLPDGLPWIGPSGLAGVWCHVGHGDRAAAQFAGAAAQVAALVAGALPPLDPAAGDLGRLGAAARAR